MFQNKKPSFLPFSRIHIPFSEAGPSALELAAMAPPELDTFAQEAGSALGGWAGVGDSSNAQGIDRRGGE